MRRLWRWYQQCLATHPVRTQVVSSGILWGLGDIGAQAVTHYSARPDRRGHASSPPEDKDNKDNKDFKVDWKRVGITSSFGFAFVGPVGHYWYEYLDRFIRRRFQPNTFKFVASKVAADGFLFGPLDLLLFFSYVGLGQGRSVEQVKEDVKRDFIPALVLVASCHGLSSRETPPGSSGSRRSRKAKTRRVRRKKPRRKAVQKILQHKQANLVLARKMDANLVLVRKIVVTMQNRDSCQTRV